MSTPRINYSPPLTTHIVSSGVITGKSFVLIDVGASGGIEDHWYAFGDSLRAFGIDPLIEEVNKLNRESKFLYVKYYSMFVTYKKYDELFPPSVQSDKLLSRDNQPFERSSSVRATKLMELDYVKTYFDQSGSGVYSDVYVELDEFCSQHSCSDVDFIKIDTDGSDYQVLLSAQNVLKTSPVLGAFVECQFHGPVHDQANIFNNIDRFMRSQGFSLFDLEVYRYSRSVLPGRFVYKIPAQTHRGQVLWADALYLRDAGGHEYEKMWDVRLSTSKILKLACILEIYGLEDCAVELLLKYTDSLSGLVDLDLCLNLITPEIDGMKLSYEEYNNYFNENVDVFFPKSRGQGRT